MDQSPRMSDLLSKCVTALLGDLSGDRRVARERYAQSGPTGGRYGDIVRGWRGQAELVRARLMKEVMATRLDSSEGQELKDLAKSEYFAELPTDPRKAVGSATLVRTVTNASSATSGNFTASEVPAGTKLKRTIGKAPRIPAKDAEYVTLQTVPCPDADSGVLDNGDGSFTHTQQIVVDVEATREGPHANIALFTTPGLNPSAGTVSSELVDKFTVLGISAAGGTLGVVDDQIRALARAMSTGSNGPTQSAAIAGSLTNPSTRRAVYYFDPAAAVATLFLADESWATSTGYLDAALDGLRSFPWIGWGCKVTTARVVNQTIQVNPTIILRSREYESALPDISAAVQKALQAYFDERPDWYTWTLNAIGSVIGGADDRILACTAVSVLDDFSSLIAAVDDFGVITGDEPPAVATPIGNKLVHYWLLSVTPSYSSPGG